MPGPLRCLGAAGLALLLAAAGCSDRPAPAGCAADRDCGVDHICLSGVCRDLSAPCASDAGCLSGQVCAAGVCVAACAGDHECPQASFCRAGHCEAGCSSDGDCPIGTVCNPLKGLCETGCTLDAHCGTGQRCLDGQCHTPACVIDADCPAGQRCLDGDCQIPPCASDADCATGQRCLAGVCQDPECSGDADCPSGQRCQDGWCADPECVFNADCAPDQICTDGRCLADGSCGADADCPGGSLCLNGGCVEADCRADGDCPAGQICQAGWCTDGGCSGDADCPAGQHCLAGDCTSAQCLTDADCPTGQVCQDGSCSLPTACDLIAQDCPDGQKCSVDGEGLPVCAPAGSGAECLAGLRDDCPAGQLCTGYAGFACHDLCQPSSGAGCAPGVACSALAGVPDLGTCQCDPLQQNCPSGQRCLHDGSLTPSCLPAGDGSECYLTGLDDCPPGMLCATADGVNDACWAYCLQASGLGCMAYEGCYPVGDIPTYGLCVGDCHPLFQDCGGGYKCTLDETDSPICWTAGSGAACRAAVEDDCPAGDICANYGQGFDCHAFCVVFNGLGCAAGESCGPLDGSTGWGACVQTRSDSRDVSQEAGDTWPPVSNKVDLAAGARAGYVGAPGPRGVWSAHRDGE